jgi:predicted secreted protein
MALAGDTTVITVATGISSTVMITDGIKQFSISDSREMYDITDFADGNVRARINGLRDYQVSLSGELESVSTAYLFLRSSYESGVPCAIRTHLGGPAGASLGYAYLCLVESLEISASVDGTVEFSASLQSSSGTAPFLHV